MTHPETLSVLLKSTIFLYVNNNDHPHRHRLCQH